jgi:hypothetical protein
VLAQDSVFLPVTSPQQIGVTLTPNGIPNREITPKSLFFGLPGILLL